MRILVVEDEVRMGKLLRRGLVEEKHSVAVIGDGREGLAFAKTYDFDMIVLDIMLRPSTVSRLCSSYGMREIARQF